MGIGTKVVVGADPLSLVASVQELDLRRGSKFTFSCSRRYYDE